MVEKSKRRLLTLCIALLITCYAVAQGEFLFHDLEINPQYDNQVMYYANDLLIAVHGNALVTYLMTVRKYPLFYTLPFTPPPLKWHRTSRMTAVCRSSPHGSSVG